MESIRELLPLKGDIERRLAEIRTKQAEEGIAPVAHIERVCPTCKYPFSELVHGWVKDYSEHSSHEGHYCKYGYCEVPCPTCSGDAQTRALARKQAELVARLFGGANIPYMYRNWTFETYPANADQKAKHEVQGFVQRHLTGDEEGKRSLYMGGPSGRCKTSLAISALKAVLEAGHPGLFVMTVELMSKIQATYNKGSAVHGDELLEAVVTVPWLVLDDLAVEQPSRDVLKHFYYIVSKRLQDGLYTIFTSNLSTTNLEEYWRPEGLKKGEFHQGVRIVERMLEMCQGVTVTGRNARAERGYHA